MNIEFTTLASLKAAVSEARSKAEREARAACGRGFYRSRGMEWAARDARGEKLTEAGVWYWDGTKRGLAADVSRLQQQFPTATYIGLEGGWDYAATMADMKDGGHEPWVSEWDITVCGKA